MFWFKTAWLLKFFMIGTFNSLKLNDSQGHRLFKPFCYLIIATKQKLQYFKNKVIQVKDFKGYKFSPGKKTQKKRNQ